MQFKQMYTQHWHRIFTDHCLQMYLCFVVMITPVRFQSHVLCSSKVLNVLSYHCLPRFPNSTTVLKLKHCYVITKSFCYLDFLFQQILSFAIHKKSSKNAGWFWADFPMLLNRITQTHMHTNCIWCWIMKKEKHFNNRWKNVTTAFLFNLLSHLLTIYVFVNNLWAVMMHICFIVSCSHDQLPQNVVKITTSICEVKLARVPTNLLL